MRSRQIGIQLDRPRQAPGGGNHILAQVFALTQKICRFRRFAVTQNTIQQHLRVRRSILPQQRDAKHIDDRVIVGILLLKRCEQFHCLPRLAGF